jgi:N-acyl-phosphatidylethanolamine-hydrolysing phospholipase D
VWTGLVPRAGGARLVPFDRDAIMQNPSVTWIGHSTMLVRMDGVTFLTDPVFSERAGPVSFVGPKRHVPPGVPLEALPPIDFAVVSHDHYDHLDLPSIAALAARGTRFVVPLGMGELIAAAGGTATGGAATGGAATGGTADELDWWGSLNLGSVRVHCVPALHFGGRSITDGNRRLWAAWVIEGPTRRFFHGGDTGYFDGFVEVGKRLGPIDLAAMPIGAYDPRSIMQFVHLDPEEAVQAARDLRARRVVAMHWGTFDLTDEPLDEPPRRFHAAAAQHGLSDRAWTLNVGETRCW